MSSKESASPMRVGASQSHASFLSSPMVPIPDTRYFATISFTGEPARQIYPITHVNISLITAGEIIDRYQWTLRLKANQKMILCCTDKNRTKAPFNSALILKRLLVDILHMVFLLHEHLVYFPCCLTHTTPPDSKASRTFSVWYEEIFFSTLEIICC